MGATNKDSSLVRKTLLSNETPIRALQLIFKKNNNEKSGMLGNFHQMTSILVRDKHNIYLQQTITVKK
jgi:translation elongation factor EF-4